MKKAILIAAALGTLALTGCAHRISIIDPARPQVFVSDGYIVVNQEPVVVRRPVGKSATVTWTVPWGSKVRFAPNGITVDAFVKPPPGQDRRAVVRDASRVSLFKCQPNEDRTEFSCFVSNEVPPGFYAYTIRLLADGKPLELDPTIMVE
jgi:hypothetical protein